MRICGNSHRWTTAISLASMASIAVVSCNSTQHSTIVEFTKCVGSACLADFATAEVDELESLTRSPGTTSGEWNLYDPSDAISVAVGLVSDSSACASADSVTVTVTDFDDQALTSDGIRLPMAVVGWADGQPICRAFAATPSQIPERTLEAAVEAALNGENSRILPVVGASVSDDVP